MDYESEVRRLYKDLGEPCPTGELFDQCVEAYKLAGQCFGCFEEAATALGLFKELQGDDQHQEN